MEKSNSKSYDEQIKDMSLEKIEEEYKEGKQSWARYIQARRIALTSIHFEKLARCLIRSSRLTEACSVLDFHPEVTEQFDDFGTLLHYAVLYDNVTFIRHLLKFNIDVNRLTKTGSTALVLAVRARRTFIAKILLEHNADIDIPDRTGKSALQLVIEKNIFDHTVVDSFMSKLGVKAGVVVNQAKRIIAAGGNMFHAVSLMNDLLLEYMCDFGIDINSKGYKNMTALHVVALKNQYHLAKWLLGKGADVNAIDENGNTPLSIFAHIKNKEMVKILLEKGADPNCKDCYGHTPLYKVFGNSHFVTGENIVACAELLLRYGAIPHQSEDSSSRIFHCPGFRRNFDKMNYLVAYLAILKMIGTFSTKFMIRNRSINIVEELESTNFYESCQQM